MKETSDNVQNIDKRVSQFEEKLSNLTKLVKLLQSFADGQETVVDKLKDDVAKLNAPTKSQSSLDKNELEFQSLRAKQKKKPQQLTSADNMMSLVQEMDEQFKMME